MEVKNMTLHTVKYKLVFGTDVNAADTTQTIPLHLPGHGGYLLHFYGRVNTVFAGVTKPEVSVGHTDDTDAIMKKQHLTNIGLLVTGSLFTKELHCDRLDVFMGVQKAPEIRLTFTSSSGNLSALTAGEIEFVAVYAI